MSSPVEPRTRLSARLAALALVAAGLAGCSADVDRFGGGPGPFHAARSNTPPAEMATGTVRSPHGNPAPSGRVESQPLPDAGGGYPSQGGGYQGSSSALPAPPSRYARPAAAPLPERTAAAPAPSRPAAQAGVHIVQPRETLITIAKHYRKPPAEIARANGVKPDSRVRIGQRLTIPGVPQAKIKQPAPEPKVAAAPAKPAPQQQAQAKPAKPAAPEKVAEKKPAEKKVEKVAERKVASLGAPPSNLKEPVEKARIATPGNDAAADAKDSQPAVTGATSPTFRWPVRGRVIAGFGAKPNGQQNDGINVAVPEGTSVKAAEDGVVAYAGNELKGYGNLVLVRHPNGYVTAYAHASELKVKRGDTIKRGQIIATAGQTGGVGSPQLHFEIRKGSTPVDPLPYLAGGN